MIGEVFGNYRVTAKLGEGGMGAVYLAEHPSIGRKVAVKIIRPAFASDAETLRRFVREARSTATLRHPALVDIMDYGVHEKTGSAYIIMEYLEGESLDARLEREGRLDPPKAAAIARQIALGMAAAHRAGIIHRDLKPGNVHLGVDPERPGADVVKVLDFGIAKLANSDTGAGPTTRTDVLLGTPRYMAPEQCRGGGSLDHRADIYSLGCLLYEALCGQPPFAYQWPGELIAAHLAEEPAPPRAFLPAIPAALESIVMRAIAKHPDHRQQAMSDVARELEQYLAIDVSVPPVAIGPSAIPAARSDFPARGASATTTASVVMRQPPGAPAGHAPAVPPKLAPPAFSELPRRQGRSRSDGLSTPLRRTLIGAGALAAALSLIAIGIATQKPAKPSASEGASPPLAAATPSADGPPAVVVSPSSEAPSSMDEAARAAPPAPAALDDPATISTNPAEAATVILPTTTPETTGSAIRIKIANPRPGLRVTVDGRSMSLPVRLPRDQKAHVLSFSAPNFKPETKTITADQDHTLTLEYRPKLYVP